MNIKEAKETEKKAKEDLDYVDQILNDDQLQLLSNKEVLPTAP